MVDVVIDKYIRQFFPLEPAFIKLSYVAGLAGTYLFHLAVELEILKPPLPAGASIPVETPRADKGDDEKTPAGLGKSKNEDEDENKSIDNSNINNMSITSTVGW